MRLKVALVAFGVAAATVACGADTSTAPRVLRVEAGQSISDAVDHARTGDIVLIEPGTYHESLKVRVDGITIRGQDRNTVILDGQNQLPNGVTVVANNVAVENLTVHSYTQNGILFNGIEAATKGGGVDAGVVYGMGNDALTGFRVSYVTSYNNGLYGIYAFASRDGLIENSYVSGHPDSGLYIGQCKPCNTVIRRVTAELNAIGYYGTNASGNLFLVESVFTHNRLGIAPNSQRAERLSPQSMTSVVGNLVVDNDDPLAPPVPGGYFGVGIAIGGGNENLIARNRVEDNKVAGISIISMNEFIPTGNRIEGNVSTGNGVDLLYAPTRALDAGKNCFAGNTFVTSLPVAIETSMSCDGASLTSVPVFISPSAPAGGDYRSTPAPPPQEAMAPAAMSASGGAGPVPAIDVAAIPVPTR